jgi:hypothetical protein
MCYLYDNSSYTPSLKIISDTEDCALRSIDRQL